MTESVTEQPRTPWWRWGVIVVLIVLPVFLLAWLFVTVAHPSGPGATSGDGLDIRLAGVIPAMGADLRDASGERVGPCLGVDGVSYNDSHLTFTRVLVFDVPQNTGNIVFARHAVYRPAGQPSKAWQGIGFGGGRLEQPVDGRYFLNLGLFREYHTRSPLPWPLSIFRKQETKTLIDADVALYYWYGPRGKADFTFEGPFDNGAELSAGSNNKCTLVVKDSSDATSVDLELKGRRADEVELLAYDREGRRHPSRRQRSKSSPTQLLAGVVVEGLSPSDIAFITVGEEPSRRVFHNIAVFREAWPDFFAEYKAAIDERSGGQADISEFWANFNSPQAALAAADLLRGGHIVEVFRNGLLYEPWDPAALDAVTRDTALKGARLWLTAWDPRIRGAGACLGAFISFDEFRDEIFASLESEDREVRDWVVETLWCSRDGLTGEDISRIADVLRGASTRLPQDKLMSIINTSDTPEARKALLSFALDDRPELWCRGLADARAVAALEPFGEWPEERMVRRYIAMGRKGRSENPDEALAKAAAGMLPSLLTAHLAAIDRAAFREVLRATGDLCDKDVAIAALVEFIRGARSDGRCSNQIVGAIEYINGLAGVNIAHIGSDFNYEFTVNYAQAAGDAIEWYETRKVPVDVPDGYRAKKGDLRIICVDKKSGEVLAIGLCMKGVPDASSRQQVMEFDGGPLAFQVGETEWRDVSGPTTRYHVEISYRQGSGEISITAGEIPCVFKELNPWDIHIEHADSPQSAVSVTKVFEQWWEKYGPAGVTLE